MPAPIRPDPEAQHQQPGDEQAAEHAAHHQRTLQGRGDQTKPAHGQEDDEGEGIERHLEAARQLRRAYAQHDDAEADQPGQQRGGEAGDGDLSPFCLPVSRRDAARGLVLKAARRSFVTLSTCYALEDA